MRSFGNFCVASVLGSSCTTCTLRSCAPYAPINSSKERMFRKKSNFEAMVSVSPRRRRLFRRSR
ncbi:MAG: hypothetical protein LBJ16_00590 [Holosporaceae bacterium]|nr:hypothetical protein [Holosporaceae bacterium]